MEDVIDDVTLFTQQFKIQMLCVLYSATYNSPGGSSKARSVLTTALYKEKNKLVRIK